VKIAYFSYGVLTATRAHNLQTVQTVNALVRRGHALTFINPRFTVAEPVPAENLPGCDTLILPAGRLFGFHVSRTGKGRFWSLFLDRSSFALRALWQLRTASFDVFVTRDMVVCLWLLATRWLTRTPVVYELHTLEQVMFDAEDPGAKVGDPELARKVRALTQSDFAGHQDDPSFAGRCYKRFLRRIEGWVLRHARTVLVLTSSMAQRLQRDFAVHRVSVVPSGHGFDAAALAGRRFPRAQLGLPPDISIAIHAGLALHGKGLDLLFAVAARLPPDCLILVLGEEPAMSARLATLAQDLGIGQIMFQPRVVHAQVASYLRAADIGLVLYPPSRYLAEFSSPLKLMEYLACGLPALATRLPALQEIVDDGLNGRLVAPDDAEAIAALLVETLRDRALLARLADGAKISSLRYHHDQRARLIEAAIIDGLGLHIVAEGERCCST